MLQLWNLTVLLQLVYHQIKKQPNNSNIKVDYYSTEDHAECAKIISKTMNYLQKLQSLQLGIFEMIRDVQCSTATTGSQCSFCFWPWSHLNSRNILCVSGNEHMWLYNYAWCGLRDVGKSFMWCVIGHYRIIVIAPPTDNRKLKGLHFVKQLKQIYLWFGQLSFKTLMILNNEHHEHCHGNTIFTIQQKAVFKDVRKLSSHANSVHHFYSQNVI